MSKFTTTVPTGFNDVLTTLPKGSFFTATRLSDDRKSLIIEWENDDWKTPFTVPVEVAQEALIGKQPLPATVKVPEGFKKVQNGEVAPKPPRKAHQKPEVTTI